MIIAKPKFTTLFSFAVFLLLSGFVLYLNIRVMLDEPQIVWYRVLIIALLSPICLYLIYRIFFQYKKISIGNNKFRIDYPLRGVHRIYEIKQIESWKEDVVKTGKSSQYRELVIKFNSGQTLTMGMQEYTEYKKIIGYLHEKAARKKI
jgi:hypothetical protein